MSVFIDIIGGAVGAFTAVLAAKGYDYNKSRDKKSDVKTTVIEAVEEENRITKIESSVKEAKDNFEWIREQLGPNPNSGGAMEQLLKMVRGIEKSLTDHLAWHVEKDDR